MNDFKFEIGSKVRVIVKSNNSSGYQHQGFKYNVASRYINGKGINCYGLDNGRIYIESNLEAVTYKFKSGDFVKITRQTFSTENGYGMWVGSMKTFIGKHDYIFDTNQSSSFLENSDFWFPNNVLELVEICPLELDSLIIDTTDLVVDIETITFNSSDEPIEISFPCK